MARGKGKFGLRQAVWVAVVPGVLGVLGAFPSGAKADTGRQPAQAAQAAAIDFDIPAGSLGNALTRFGLQSSLQVSFAPELVQDLRSQGLRGRHAPMRALERLLDGTGLVAEPINASTVVVRRSRTGPARPAAAAPAAGQAAEPDPVELQAIMVTGEKTRRGLQDTTSSVAVTTSARIEEENIRDLYDVLGRTANVTQTVGNTGFSIRGIRNSEGGGQAPLSTIYVDGLALPAGDIDSAPLSTWDVAQAEVLRGPQSTIQGQNALAGAIVLRTEDPTMDWSGRARLQLSDPADRSLAFAGGGPLVADQLAFRVSVESRNFDGFIHNPTRGVSEDPLDSVHARFKLLWTPEALPGLTARLSHSWYDRDGAHRLPYINSTEPDYLRRPVNLSDFPNTSRNLGRSTHLGLDYVFSDRWSLSSVTAWSRSSVDLMYDEDHTAQSIAYLTGRTGYENESQELRLHYRGDRLQGLAGLYWSQREMHDAAERRITVETPVATIASQLRMSGFPADMASMIAGLYYQALPSVPVDYVGWARTDAENKALFADGELRLGERWWLLGGLRYDRETYSGENDGTAVFAGIWPNPADYGAPGTPLHLAIAAINQGVAHLVAQGGTASPLTTQQSDALLPKLGLRFGLAEDVSLGFVVQRAYRSGGASYNNARSAMYEYDPEYAWNYELSLRSQWLDGRLTLNANAYYFDWKDKQTSFNFGLNSWDFHTLNAGRAHMHGFEVEVNHRVGGGFDWYGSVGHSRSRYDEFIVPDGASGFEDYSGSEFGYAPRWTAALGANWRFGEGWLANLNASYRDSMLAQISTNAYRLEPRTLVNAKFGYSTLGWSAYLFARNLLDERYVSNGSPTREVAVLGDPRVAGIGFEAYW